MNCVCCGAALVSPLDTYGPVGEPWCFGCWVTDPQGEAGCRNPALSIGGGHRSALISAGGQYPRCRRCMYMSTVLVDGLCPYCAVRGAIPYTGEPAEVSIRRLRDGGAS